jgi:hypothetical protein
MDPSASILVPLIKTTCNQRFSFIQDLFVGLLVPWSRDMELGRAGHT